MPKFYLSIRWDGKHEDLEGEEFETVHEARNEAITSIREIVAEGQGRARVILNAAS